MTVFAKQRAQPIQARQRFARGAALACLLLLGILACGRERGEPNVALNADGADASGAWQAGVHYARIEPSQRPSVPVGKIEVVEAFWYGCAACYVFEPRLVLWEKTKPAYIHLVRLPAVLSLPGRAHARLYYTLQAVGRDDLHHSVYDTIHRSGNPLLAGTDTETFQRQLEFAKSHGIAEDEFTKTYHSAAVTAAVAGAEQLARLYLIELTPTMIVNGRYKTDIPRAGGDDHLLSIVQYLVSQERREQ